LGKNSTESESAFDLTGKTALVTGGNGGIGLEMAEALAQSGVDICIWGHNEEKNKAAAEKLRIQSYSKFPTNSPRMYCHLQLSKINRQ